MTKAKLTRDVRFKLTEMDARRLERQCERHRVDKHEVIRLAVLNTITAMEERKL